MVSAAVAVRALVVAVAARCSATVTVGRRVELATEVHKDRQLDALPRSLINSTGGVGLEAQFPYYHSYSQVQAEVSRLAKSCKGMMSVHTVEESNVSIEVVRLQMPRRPEQAPAANRVIIVAGEHARELIGSESALHLLRALCGEVLLRANHSAEEALKDSEFEIVLNASPRARKLVEEGDYCRRLNPQGVDLNRNWDEQWSPNSSMGGGGGPHPFSEPETRILRRILEEYQPTLFLTVHSGTRGLYMPWAYEVQQDLGQKQRAMLQVLRAVDVDHCRCPFGAAGYEVGYACPGTSIDWAYGHLKTPYTFAFEIWGGNASLLQRRWEMKLFELGAEAVGQSSFGLHLSHPHFRSIFEQHPSDFVKSVFDQSPSDVVKFEDVIRHDKEAASSSQMGMTRFNISDMPEVRMTCFRTFNPVTLSSYQKAVENWAEAFLDTAQLVAKDILSGNAARESAQP